MFAKTLPPIPNPMAGISKASINKWIVPSLSSGKRGNKPKLERWQIVATILYKLKTACQGRELPTKEFFDQYRLSWQGVYYHFRRWIQDGSIRRVWLELLKQ